MLYHWCDAADRPFMERLPAALLEVRPTIFVAVPRVYEKIYAQAEQKAKGFPKRTIFNWAVAVGRTAKPKILSPEKFPHRATGNWPTSWCFPRSAPD